METMAAHIGGELSDLVPVVTRGERLDRDACLRLWRTDDLTGLGVLANLVRERVNGNRAFVRAALRASAGEDLESLLSATDGASAGELHLEGTDLHRLVRRARELAPNLRPRACTWTELEQAAGAGGSEPQRVLRGLADAGLHHLAGGALNERHLPWVEAAASLGMRAELHWFVHGDEPAEVAVDTLLELRRLSEVYPIFACLTPLLRTPPAEGVEMPDPTGYNCLRAIAVGRLCLDRMPHVRGSVEALGESVMQVAQWYGADDAGSVAPPARERLAELLRAAGREPVELLIE
ncbi:MAG: hypothetical protein DMG07_04320 [Acidobacteria bacterium]|nr:MAG: hypothetical protein DMG07_04320 [Acidobacteriota bacterium]